MGCIGVVFIHITYPGIVGQLVSKASQFAVPIFLMIAGYYSYSINEAKIKRRFGKICKILIYGIIVYLSYIIHDSAVNNIGLLINTKDVVGLIPHLLSVKQFIKLIVFCTIDFAIPLWYLIAMAETYVCWYYVVKYKKEVSIVKCLPLLMLFRIGLTSICETLGLSWFWKINFITCALVWFVIGYYFHSIDVFKFKSSILFAFSIFGYFISILNTIFSFEVDISCVGIMLYAVCLFLIALKNPDKHISSVLEFIGDKLSLNIYILHVPIGSFVMTIANYFGIMNDFYLWFHPLITAIITITVSYIIFICGNKYIHTKTKRISVKD